MRLWSSFAAPVRGTSLFIARKYARLKRRLTKDKFSHENINNLGYGTALILIIGKLVKSLH